MVFITLHALGNYQMYHGAQFIPSSLISEFASKINRFLLSPQNLTTELKDTKPHRRQEEFGISSQCWDHLFPLPLQIGHSQDKGEARSCQHESCDDSPKPSPGATVAPWHREKIHHRPWRRNASRKPWEATGNLTLRKGGEVTLSWLQGLTH